jgi:hypothetical protein
MRKFATAVAILALASLATANAAEKDFATLLAELSFGEADQLINTAPARPVDNSHPVAATGTGQRPLSDPYYPAPTANRGRHMPVGRQAAPQAYAQSSPPGVPAHPVGAQSAYPTPAPRAYPTPAQSAYPTPAPPINPASAPLRDPSDRVDLNTAFAVQETGQVPVQPAGHTYGKRYADCGYETRYPPRPTPDLPNSTLHQYFRSNKCHTNVWVGYHQKCCPSLRNISLPFKHLFKGGCLEGCGSVVDGYPRGGCGCEPQRGGCGCEPQRGGCGCEPQRGGCGCEPQRGGCSGCAGYYQ